MTGHLGQSVASPEPTELERLCAATTKAINCAMDADAAAERRDTALQELREILGWGDLLAVVYNAQRRIGELMTEEEA